MFMQQVWHIEPQRARALLPLVISFLEGKIDPEQFKSEVRPAYVKPGVTMQTASTGELPDAMQEGLIAVIPVSGVMVKYSPWYNPGGMKDVATWFSAAAANENVDAIILHIDSPGGMVDGTQELVDLFAACPKPVISFVDGCMASAAYLVGCTADEIIAMNDTCVIGSIGTMWSSLDIIPLLEKFGAKYYEAYADASTDKNAEWKQMEKGNDKPLKENMLNPLNENFIANVKKYRGDKINENVLSGAAQLAQLALRNGLIDAIGSFEYAVSRARELAAAQKKTAAASQTQQGMKKFIASLKNMISFLSVKENDEITEEHLTKVDAELGTHLEVKAERDQLQSEAANLRDQVNALTTTKQALEQELSSTTHSLTEAQNSRDEWKAKAEKYGAKDGSEAGKEVKGEKDPIEGKKEAVLPSMKVMQEHFAN